MPTQNYDRSRAERIRILTEALQRATEPAEIDRLKKELKEFIFGPNASEAVKSPAMSRLATR